MWSDLRYLLSTFPPGTKARLCLYAVLQFVSSLLDLAGLAAVFPVMQVLTGAPLNEGYLGTIHHLAGGPARPAFVVILCSAMVLAFLAKTIVALAISWWSSGLVMRLQIRSAVKLLRAYLGSDYLLQRRRDASGVVRTIGSSVIVSHYNVLGGLLNLFGHLLSVVIILTFLAAVAPMVTLAAFVYFGLVVVLIQFILGSRNRDAGKEAQVASAEMNQVMLESIYAAREVRLHGAQEYFLSRFHARSLVSGSASRRANFFGIVPKYLLELATIFGISLLLVAASLSSAEADLMPVLTLFVAAAVKLLPIMTAVTVTSGNVRFGQEALRLTANALRGNPQPMPSSAPRGAVPSVEVARRLSVDNVYFRYPDGSEDVLHGVDFHVDEGSSVAICGLSGSGKTTLIDVLLGLIEPTRGRVTYGGAEVGEPEWLRSVGYVPQDVQLLAAPLWSNVAFGVEADLVDRQRVGWCIEQAQLSDLVESLTGGIDAVVGGLHGTQLSGGQRQRLGIARALYGAPSLLILDEATSALDNETEGRITDLLHELRGTVTTVLVAHRLSTVKYVDQIVFLENGVIVAKGSFEDVQGQSETFARLVRLGSLEGPREV